MYLRLSLMLPVVAVTVVIVSSITIIITVVVGIIIGINHHCLTICSQSFLCYGSRRRFAANVWAGASDVAAAHTPHPGLRGPTAQLCVTVAIILAEQ